MIQVKIISFPANQVCRCNSWINHYNKFSHRVVRMCVAEDCQNGNFSGIHVQKIDPDDQRIYILPLCDFHAGSIEGISIRPLSKFVNATTKETCGEINFGFLKGTDL